MSQIHRRDTVIGSTSPALPQLRNETRTSGPEFPDADSALRLNKKKSWFGGLRDVLQKGALQAKTIVDSVRNAPVNHEQVPITTGNGTEEESQPNESKGDAATISNDEPHSLTPKSAKMSSRYRVQLSATKRHNNGKDVFRTNGQASSEMSHVMGPEWFEASLRIDGNTEPHKRNSSVATSIVGSIRALGRKKNIAAQYSPEEPASFVKTAERIPLPSSPIDIPSAAPALDLDLGPLGILSSWSSGTERVQEALKLTDVPTGRPVGSPPPIHRGNGPISTTSIRSTTPADLLSLKVDAFSNVLMNRPPGPSTPMPGTNMPMELDGADSDKSVRSQCFERGVTPTTSKERKQLRSMRSLDAMAEACAVAHAHDDEMMLPSAISPKTTYGSDFHSLPASGSALSNSPILGALSSRRGLTSASTLHSCPSDMEELTRVHANESCINDAGLVDRGKLDDSTLLSSNSQDSGLGPPSPSRRVILPFRPKAETIADISASESRLCSRKSIGSEAGHLESNNDPAIDSPKTSEQDLELQLELQRRDELLPGPLFNTPERPEEKRITIFDDDPSLRDQQLFVSNVILPNYESQDSTSIDDVSSHEGLLAAQLCNNVVASPFRGPVVVPAQSPATAHNSDADYTFHFDNWAPPTFPTHRPAKRPHLLGRQYGDDTIDAFSPPFKETQGPQISPQSINEECMSPSRTEAGGNQPALESSKRAHNQHTTVDQSVGLGGDCSSEQMALAFILNDAQDPDAIALASIDIDEAYASPSTVLHSEGEKTLGEPRRDSALPFYSKTDELVFGEYKFESQLSPLDKTASQQREVPLPRTETVSPAFQDMPVKAPDEAIDSDCTSPRPSMLYSDPGPSTNVSTALTVMDPLGQPTNCHGGHLNERSELTINSPRPCVVSRVTSADTLDCSLDLYDAPMDGDSGVPKTATIKSLLAPRYRNPAARGRRMTLSIDEVTGDGL